MDARNSEGSSGNRSSAAAVTTLDVPMQGHPVKRQTPDLPGVEQTTSIHVVWDAPYGNGLPITSYILDIDDINSTTLDATLYTPQFVQGGFEPGTAHTFRVRAVNAKGEGPPSAWATLETQKGPPGRPSPPTSLGAVDETTLRVRVNEAPYTGGYAITRYELEVEYASSGSQVTEVLSLAMGDLVTDVTGYRKGSTYKFRARAISTEETGDELASEWSDVLEVLGANTERPAAPTGLQADPDDAAQSCQLDHATGRWACQLGVRWEQPTGNATVNYYRINYDESLEYCEPDAAACDHRRLSHAVTSQSVTLAHQPCSNSTALCATLTGLRPAASYTLSVTGVNEVRAPPRPSALDSSSKKSESSRLAVCRCDRSMRACRAPR